MSKGLGTRMVKWRIKETAMRKKIYETVHIYEGSALSVIYKWFMIGVIVLSIIPLTVKEHYSVFAVTDKICLVIYIADYILRWVTADYKFNNQHWSSFAKYPFRFISIVDLMSIVALTVPVSRAGQVIKFANVFKVFRIVRLFRYSKAIRTVAEIFARTKKALAAVGALAIGYVFISALIVFCVEPDTFKSFFEAVYWSTISLTTVGYGDIYPITTVGKFISMVSSFFGIAVVALPSGIITAEYMKKINEDEE